MKREKACEKITMNEVGEYLSKTTKTEINYSMLSYLDERPKSKRWTKREVEILRHLKERCLPTELVSHIMKRSYAAIHRRMRMHENNIKSTYLPRWTKKEVDTLIQGRADGLSLKAISIKTGRTTLAVQLKWHRMNAKE